MYCIASQRVIPALTDDHRYDLLKEAPLSSLAQLLEAVPDPRGRHGLRYDLPFLLCCLIAALLCNCTSSEAVAQWCREHQALLRQVFGPRLFLTPSGSLYRWLLPRLCADSFERVLAAWVPKPMKPLRSMAKPCAEPPAGSRTLPSSWLSVRMRARRPCCKSGSMRKPTRFRWPKRSSRACPWLGGSVRLTRCIPMLP